jgi:hypothetical protein
MLVSAQVDMAKDNGERLNGKKQIRLLSLSFRPLAMSLLPFAFAALPH